MADYSDDDDVRASFSEDDENPYSHKGYGGHSGGSSRYKLPRRSETYSGNLGSRRSGGERFHRAPSYDRDEEFDSGMQLSRSGGTDLSKRGNGRFGWEAPNRRDTYQQDAGHYDEGYGPGYSPWNERYPLDFEYSPRSHASGNKCMGHSEVKHVHVTHLHKHNHYYGLPKYGAPPRQKERSDRKEWEDLEDARLPPGKKSGKICTPLTTFGSWVIPSIASTLTNSAAEHYLRRPSQ